MMEFWTTILKPAIIAIGAWFLSIFSPVEDVFWLLLGAFIINIVVGIVTAIHAEKSRFSMSRFFGAFMQFALYIIFVVFLYWMGHVQHDGVIADTGIKWVTYIVIYCYFLNIFRNARTLWPKARAIDMIYQTLSTEVLAKLKDQIGLKFKKRSDENTD
jgi:heme A synthase